MTSHSYRNMKNSYKNTIPKLFEFQSSQTCQLMKGGRVVSTFDFQTLSQVFAIWLPWSSVENINTAGQVQILDMWHLSFHSYAPLMMQKWYFC